MEYLPALLRNCTRALSKARHAQKPAFKRPFVMLPNETKTRQNGLTSDLDVRRWCLLTPLLSKCHLTQSKLTSGPPPRLSLGRAQRAPAVKSHKTVRIKSRLSRPKLGIRGVSGRAEPSDLSPIGWEGAVIFPSRRTDKAWERRRWRAPLWAAQI